MLFAGQLPRCPTSAGRDAAATDAVRRAIEWTGGRAEAFLADVTRFEAIEAMRLAIEERLGPIEILVTTAGGNALLPRSPDTCPKADY
jgi:NAD(P)-dependent dehydrogenase (short-subunit alcohol dehydrogenase family)